MTKDKTNDFIKIKVVKEYIKSKGWCNEEQFLTNLRNNIKLMIDNYYIKTEVKEEPKKEGFVDKLTSVANDLNNSVGDLVNKF